MGLAESVLCAAQELPEETAFGVAARDLITALPNATDAELALLESALSAARGLPPAAAPQTLVSLSDELLLDVAGQLSFSSDVTIRSICRRTNAVLMLPSRTRAKVLFLAEGTARLREQQAESERSLAQAKSELEQAQAENEGVLAYVDQEMNQLRVELDERFERIERNTEEAQRRNDENGKKIDENKRAADETKRRLDEFEKRADELSVRLARLESTQLPNESQKKRLARRAARSFYRATAMRLLRGDRARKPTVADTKPLSPRRCRRGAKPEQKLDSSVLLALLCAGDTSQPRLVAAQNLGDDAGRRSRARPQCQRRGKGAPRRADLDRKSRSQKRRT